MHAQHASLAKLAPPRMYAAVPRARVFADLDEKLSAAPVVWIAAPPGAGKTAAVVSYLETRGRPSRWMQIDEGDRDPATFFHYLAHLLPNTHSQQTRLPAFSAAHLPDLAGFARRFFQRLFVMLGRVTLVLDNCQNANSESFQVILQEAFKQVPGNANIIITSRSAPDKKFLRMCISGLVAELGWEDLRLTPEEAAEIARALDPGRIAHATDLHSACGGWLAGLTLLLRGRKRGEQAVAFASREALFDYFSEERFDAAEDRWRQVLVCSALVPQVTAEMACALCNDEQAGAILEELHRQQYFVDRRAGDEITFQFHDIFRAFLLAKAPSVLGEVRLNAVHGEAARLLETKGLLTESVALHRQTRNWSEIARLIRTHALEFLDSGRWQTLIAWFQGLPEHVVTEDPYLTFWFGRSQMTCEPREAKCLILSAYRHFCAIGDDCFPFYAISDLIDLAFVTGEPLLQYEEWMPILEARLANSAPFQTLEVGVQAWQAYLTIIVHKTGTGKHFPEVANQLDAAILSGRLSESEEINAIHMLMACYLAQANFPEGQRLFLRMERLNACRNVSPVRHMFALSWLGYWSWACGDLESASRFLEMASEYTLKMNAAPQAFRMDCRRVVLLCEAGRIEAAQRMLTAIRQNAALGEDLSTGPYLQAKAAYEAATNAFESAIVTIGEALVAYETANFRLHRDKCRMAMATYCVELSRYEEALAILRDYRVQSHGSIYRNRVALSHLIECEVERRLGQDESMHAHLASALRLAENPLQAGPLLTVRRWLPTLLSAAIQRGIGTRTAPVLIRNWKLRSPTSSERHWPWPVTVRVLGPFELLVDGQPPELSRKPPTRLLTLLKAIIAMGGKAVPEQCLVDALWQGEDGDAGMQALNVAITRLRKLLGHSDAVTVVDGKISIDRSVCWVDAFAFEETATEFLAGEHFLRSASSEATGARAMELYRAPFLGMEADAPWAIGYRERLRNALVRVVQALAHHFETQGKWQCAAEHYRRGIAADPLFEQFHRGLMRCHINLGERAEALSIYRSLKRTLSVVLGIQPASETEAVYQSLYRESSASPQYLDS